MMVVWHMMYSENASRILRNNMDYGSRKERGAWSLVIIIIIIIIGTSLHGRNIVERPSSSVL